jgi:hypothetical protein
MRRRPWGDVPQPTRRLLRAILRDLGRVYDLRGLLAWRLAQQVSELWLVTRGVSLEAAQTSESLRQHAGSPRKRETCSARCRAALHRQRQRATLRTRLLRDGLGLLRAQLDDRLAEVDALLAHVSGRERRR